MPELLVLCPTRGRAAAAREAYAAFTSSRWTDAEMLFLVDADDPTPYDDVPVRRLAAEDTGSMNNALNSGVRLALAGEAPPRILGFVGDDHRFRTSGWDRKVIDALDGMGGGLVYGNDLAQRERLPTQVFINSNIVQALGWMGLPGAKHLYLDNAWLEIGTRLGRLRYLPDVVIQHCHPMFGTGEWDEGYRRVNAQEVYDHDRAVFEDWLATSFADDIERVRAVL